MSKLATLLKSRGNNCAQLVVNRNSTKKDAVFGLHNLMGHATMSTYAAAARPTSDISTSAAARPNSGISTYATAARPTSERVFAAYKIFKGKAALTAEPLPPRFSRLNSGDLQVKQSGCILLQFTPSVGERKYDWERKQVFALSATEVGSFINLGPNGSCEFFHDPGMLKSNAGQVRKSLSVKPHADGTGYFISLVVANNVTKTNERLSVPVTSAEFAVMRTSFSFVLPYLLGWDRYPSLLPQLEERSGNAQRSGNARANPLSSEWNR